MSLLIFLSCILDAGSPYGDWSLEEIEKLKDGLRMHGKAWWKVSQGVGSKNQNRCRAFFAEFQSAKGLQLKEAFEEYMKNKVSRCD